MPATERNPEAAARYRQAVLEAIEAAVAEAGSTDPIKPGHRVQFHWPPPAVSFNYHVLPSDWRGSAEVEIHGETFEVLLAKTRSRVFGRCEALWVEAMGKTQAEMIENLRKATEPLFQRQWVISRTLGMHQRYVGHIKDLPTADVLKLLYCVDRDVANDARTALETRPNKPDLLDALLEIIADERHPFRRSAQWCVLDLFEDLLSYCLNEGDELRAIEAIKNLIRFAPDDYARTTFKAGVALGGHLPDLHGGPALISCLDAPSRIGRRSAIHGLFHVVEWHPEFREEVIRALERVAKHDPEPTLREYADHMAQDIAAGMIDHVAEPTFDDEA